MDRNVDVRTPESIALRYDLAGLGSRFLAVLVDFIIQVALLLALVYGLALIGEHSPSPKGGHSAGLGDLDKIAQAILIAIVTVVVFTIFFGYFIAFETLWNGQTPGKKLLGIRVLRDGGYPVDLGAAVIRNLIRVGEVALGTYTLSAISALVSPENKRLGDLAAGTIVVRDARIASPAAFAKRPAEPVYAATAYLSGEERALVKRFLERRSGLSPERRRQLAAQIVDRIRDRLPPELARIDDEDLLERL